MKPGQKKKQDGEKEKEDKVLSAFSAGRCHFNSKRCAMVARDRAILDSGVTVHMIKDDQIIK